MSVSSPSQTDPRFVRHLMEMEGAFSRLDEDSDTRFYSKERMVEHLDRTALETVETLIGSLVIEDEPVILDLMASWDSHLPDSMSPSRMVGLGLNPRELDANPLLTQRVIQDLNTNPHLPFDDEAFDLVLNVVSVEYLTDPVAVFEEVGRVLKPGGLVLVVFSNRWFPPKVVRVWEDASEHERIGLVQEFLREADAFGEQGRFISMGLPRPEDDRYYEEGIPSDPVFAVFAEKKGGAEDRPLRPVPEDPADMQVDPREVDSRKRTVPETHLCPHCSEPLARWEVPDDPCIDWNNDYMYLCFNDACPFVVRGWRFMWEQGIEGHSYRYLFNPATDGSTTVPIRGLNDLRPGIVAGT